jgi:hypothetical protein
LRHIFAKDPRGIFTTEELCAAIYGIGKPRKKHRVAVLRAVKNLAARSIPTLWRKVSRHDRDDVWYDYRFHPGRAPDRAPAREGRPRKR